MIRYQNAVSDCAPFVPDRREYNN